MDPAMHRCAMFLSKTLLIDTLTFPIHAINEWGTGLTSHATWDSQMKKKFKVNRIIIMKLSARQFLAKAHPGFFSLDNLTSLQVSAPQLFYQFTRLNTTKRILTIT